MGDIIVRFPNTEIQRQNFLIKQSKNVHCQSAMQKRKKQETGEKIE